MPRGVIGLACLGAHDAPPREPPSVGEGARKAVRAGRVPQASVRVPAKRGSDSPGLSMGADSCRATTNRIECNAVLDTDFGTSRKRVKGPIFFDGAESVSRFEPGPGKLLRD